MIWQLLIQLDCKGVFIFENVVLYKVITIRYLWCHEFKFQIILIPVFILNLNFVILLNLQFRNKQGMSIKYLLTLTRLPGCTQRWVFTYGLTQRQHGRHTLHMWQCDVYMNQASLNIQLNCNFEFLSLQLTADTMTHTQRLCRTDT